MEYSVYAIENSNGKLYIGQTRDIEKRLKRHNQKLPAKKNGFTAVNKGDWMVIYEERFETRAEAMRREKELKTSRGRGFLKQFRRYI